MTRRRLPNPTRRGAAPGRYGNESSDRPATDLDPPARKRRITVTQDSTGVFRAHGDISAEQVFTPGDTLTLYISEPTEVVFWSLYRLSPPPVPPPRWKRTLEAALREWRS